MQLHPELRDLPLLLHRPAEPVRHGGHHPGGLHAGRQFPIPFPGNRFRRHVHAGHVRRAGHRLAAFGGEGGRLAATGNRGAGGLRSTRDIAAAVGVEQPAIYKHFSAKRDILAALVRLAVEWPLELFGHITAMPVPAVVKLHRWLTESLDHLHASPYVLVSILITPDLHQESFVAERELVAEMERALVGLIETGQGEGDVRAMHPLSAARLVQALFDALALPEFAVSPDEIVEFAMTALLSDPDR